jgi:hypothetical protein
VLDGNDEDVPRVDWLYVHEREHVLIAVDLAERGVSSNQFTKDARHVVLAPLPNGVFYCPPLAHLAA